MLNLNDRSALENYELLKKVPEYTHIREAWRDLPKSGQYYTSKHFSNLWDNKHRQSPKHKSFYHDYNDTIGQSKRSLLETKETEKIEQQFAAKVSNVNILRDTSHSRLHERKMERINVQLESQQQIYNLTPKDLTDLHFQNPSQRDSRVLNRSLNHAHTHTTRAPSAWNELSQTTSKHLNLSINERIIEKDEQAFAEIAGRIEKDAQFDQMRLNLVQSNMTKIRNAFREKSISNYEFAQKAIQSRTSPKPVASIVPDLHKIRTKPPVDHTLIQAQKIQSQYADFLEKERDQHSRITEQWSQDVTKYSFTPSDIDSLLNNDTDNQHPHSSASSPVNGKPTTTLLKSRPRTHSDSYSFNQKTTKQNHYPLASSLLRGRKDPNTTTTTTQTTLEAHDQQSPHKTTPEQQQNSKVRSVLKSRKDQQHPQVSSDSIQFVSMYNPSIEITTENTKSAQQPMQANANSFNGNNSTKKVNFDSSKSSSAFVNNSSGAMYTDSNNIIDRSFNAPELDSTMNSNMNLQSSLTEKSRSPPLRLKYLKSPQNHKLSNRMEFLSSPKDTSISAKHVAREEYRGLLCTEADKIDPRTTNSFVDTMSTRSGVFRNTLHSNDSTLMAFRNSSRRRNANNSLSSSTTTTQYNERIQTTNSIISESPADQEETGRQIQLLAPIAAVTAVHMEELERFDKNFNKEAVKRYFPSKKLDEYHMIQSGLSAIKRKDQLAATMTALSTKN